MTNITARFELDRPIACRIDDSLLYVLAPIRARILIHRGNPRRGRLLT